MEKQGLMDAVYILESLLIQSIRIYEFNLYYFSCDKTFHA